MHMNPMCYFKISVKYNNITETCKSTYTHYFINTDRHEYALQINK